MLLIWNFSFGQTFGKDTVFIFSTNFNATTIIAIPCDEFATQFENRIKASEVYASDSIAMLKQFIKKSKFYRKQGKFEPDTRGKLIYNEFEICVDHFQISINGQVVKRKRNKKFLKFILSLIPKEQLSHSLPKY
jgi:hypothetical protein